MLIESDMDVRRNFHMLMYTQWRYHQVSPKYHITKSANVSFLSILIKGFGFTTSQTLLLGMVNAYHGLVYIGFLWLGDKWKRRCLVTVIPSSISTIGIAMVWGLPADQRIARLMGFYMYAPRPVFGGGS